jgi:hypothetical protein
VPVIFRARPMLPHRGRGIRPISITTTGSLSARLCCANGSRRIQERGRFIGAGMTHVKGGGAAIALVNVTIQILVQTHPKAEIVRWLRHQADQVEQSDIVSAGGHA